ncbi:MAG: precorrin-6y C5,15-methyltransferase (decarboxylating) subunit CbiE [Ruminococcus sp.]|nr:precorrin-6y C5,15-methyltransferase (decarboxylating) subunit CbiE [Ruminococcus sp.]
MKAYIIGTGMDGVKTLTAEAKKAVREADVLIGAGRMLDMFSTLGKKTFESYKSDEISQYLRENSFDKAALLMSGDCGFYSGAEKLITALADCDTEIISGISSPVYFCSKIKKPWQDMRFISLHGTDGNIVRNVCRHRYCFFLLGGENTPDKVCKRLCGYGMEKTKVYIGENLGYDNESIKNGIASDFTELRTGSLCVMVTENPEYERAVPSGIDDARFIRGNVPMTKSEVRAAVVSKLSVGRNDICWDIGCGTGSVSVEMSLQCYDGKVYSIDKNPEAAELTLENSRRFGCDNIKVINGTAPDSLSELPAPDNVFIGGSCGKINDILRVVYKKNSAAAVLITAVSLETLSEAVKAFEKYGVDSPEVLQLAVTRAKRIGKHTMLSAENPVFIIRGVKN